MALSIYAEKLLLWFNRYRITPGTYYYHLAAHPKAEQRGLFVGAFEELLAEYGYGY